MVMDNGSVRQFTLREHEACGRLSQLERPFNLPGARRAQGNDYMNPPYAFQARIYRPPRVRSYAGLLLGGKRDRICGNTP